MISYSRTQKSELSRNARRFVGDAANVNPASHLHLRMHRARSVILTNDELVEIRAAQRTFEGAYMRTALSQFSFALIILKIFTSEFYAIGALFSCYGAAVLLVAIYRRHQGNRQFFTPRTPPAPASLSAYITLMVLTWRLSS
ncbi:hypothetical protein PG996_001652 [Apiospora saccharicola]|uniref:DUF202 domain-containing protein n=1 Tax=Apiospora saccharicola TaxID=335842 RepID=A0ABR1WH82_9PEZI